MHKTYVRFGEWVRTEHTQFTLLTKQVTVSELICHFFLTKMIFWSQVGTIHFSSLLPRIVSDMEGRGCSLSTASDVQSVSCRIWSFQLCV